MMGNAFYALLSGVSLSADSFAVSLCSSVSEKGLCRRHVTGIALVFASVQAGLLLCGWVATHFLSEWIGPRFTHFDTAANILGFLLLLYVGGTMLADAIRNKELHFDLHHPRAILLGALATSIDAFTVGISMALDGSSCGRILAAAASTFCFTGLAVAAGMAGGSVIGKRFGRPARIAGGVLLTGLAFVVLMV